MSMLDKEKGNRKKYFLLPAHLNQCSSVQTVAVMS